MLRETDVIIQSSLYATMEDSTYSSFYLKLETIMSNVKLPFWYRYTLEKCAYYVEYYLPYRYKMMYMPKCFEQSLFIMSLHKIWDEFSYTYKRNVEIVIPIIWLTM